MILHLVDKYDPADSPITLDMKIKKLFGTAQIRLDKRLLIGIEECLLEKIGYEINYVSCYSYYA